MLNFLDVNRHYLIVNKNQLADKIVELSDGKMNYRQFALWLKPKMFEN